MKYIVTLSTVEGFKVTKELEVQGDSLFEIVHKSQDALLRHLQKEYERLIQEVKDAFSNDDIPF